MNYKSKFKIMSWNVRGLNEKDKRIAIRQSILLEKPSIVCLQETKLAQFTNGFLRETCGKYLKQSRVLDANGTRGGVLIAWAENKFQEINTQTRNHTVTILLRNKEDHQNFYLTGVYGPSTATHRQEFLDELQASKPSDNTPWVVCGDFNFTIDPTDRNTDRSWAQPNRFKQFISSLGLINLPLQGRQYTWVRENGQHGAAMARLDRFLISTEWNTTYPISNQKALPNTSSDHCPILYTVETSCMKTNFFRFENLWLRSPQLKEIVISNWQQTDQATTPEELHGKLQSLTGAIRNWAKDKVTQIKDQIGVCREYIGWMDKVTEIRATTTREKTVMRLIKERYAHLTVLEEDIWKQRAKTK